MGLRYSLGTDTYGLVAGRPRFHRHLLFQFPSLSGRASLIAAGGVCKCPGSHSASPPHMLGGIVSGFSLETHIKGAP